MRLIRDLFRFLGVVLLGLKDKTKVYAESVEMAENYVRWGREKNDARDFRGALEHCMRCNDEDMPKADWMLRRYSAQAEALIGLMKHGLERFQQQNAKTINQKQSLLNEIEATRNALNEAHAETKRLEDDGSMIKARELTTHAQDIERRLERLQEQSDSGQIDSTLRSEYAKLTDEFTHQRTQFELCLVTIGGMDEIVVQQRDSLVTGFENQFARLLEVFNSLSPDQAGN